MKLLSIITILFSLNVVQANISEKCNPPAGEFTSLETVLNQFVLNNGNPNWGDWCFEGEASQVTPCYNELDQWDSWLNCTIVGYTKHCEDWADKEGFLDGNPLEYGKFIRSCVVANYKALLK